MQDIYINDNSNSKTNQNLSNTVNDDVTAQSTSTTPTISIPKPTPPLIVQANSDDSSNTNDNSLQVDGQRQQNSDARDKILPASPSSISTQTTVQKSSGQQSQSTIQSPISMKPLTTNQPVTNAPQLNTTTPQLNTTTPQQNTATPQPQNSSTTNTSPRTLTNTSPQPITSTNPQPITSANPQPITSANPQPLTPAPINTRPQPQTQQNRNNSWGTGWDDGFNNNWNDPWGAPNNNPQNQQSKRLTPEERVEIVKKLYQEVLGRQADTKDINYYKYSTLGEEEIRKQLINGKEHTDLITNGREYNRLKDRAETAETRVKVLEGQIKDQLEEFKKLADLLRMKNRYIQELREKLNNPYDLPIYRAENADMNRVAPNGSRKANSEGKSTEKPSKFDSIRKMAFKAKEEDGNIPHKPNFFERIADIVSP